MLLPIVGTVRNTVKMAMMDNKWQQRKKTGGKAVKLEEDPQIRQFKEDLQRMRENKEMSSISTKLKSGGTLTFEEIEYLKKNSPELYREYLEVQNEKAAYERQLKNCKTKEEVEKLRVSRMSSFLAEAKEIVGNANIPKEKKLSLLEKLLKKVMGDQSVHMNFVESAQYHSLPDDDKDLKEDNSKVEMVEGKLENPDVIFDEEEGGTQSEIIMDYVGSTISKVDIKYREIERAVKKSLSISEMV